MRVIQLLVLACLLGFSSCRNFKEVECTGVEGFKLNRLDTKGIDGDIVLKLKNPNSFGFSLYKSEFDVTYSGVYLGKARLAKKVRIRAREESVYAFNLTSEFKDIKVTDVMKLLTGGSFRNQVDVRGTLNAGTLFIRKGFPIQISEKIRLN